MAMGGFICAVQCTEGSAMTRHQTRDETRDQTCAEGCGLLADIALDAVTGGCGAGARALLMLAVGGSTGAAWTPRTYAVQTDLSGGVTGGQAGLYERRVP